MSTRHEASLVLPRLRRTRHSVLPSHRGRRNVGRSVPPEHHEAAGACAGSGLLLPRAAPAGPGPVLPRGHQPGVPHLPLLALLPTLQPASTETGQAGTNSLSPTGWSWILLRLSLSGNSKGFAWSQEGGREAGLQTGGRWASLALSWASCCT